MNYKLIAMDLDGTLDNDAKEITPATLCALDRVRDMGITLAIATGRPSPGLNRERDMLDMVRRGGLLMSYNGGHIEDAVTGETLYETAMPLETGRSILRMLESFPVTPILDDNHRFYVTDAKGYRVEFECRNNRMECTVVENLADFLSFEPVKILMSVEPEALPEIQRRIAERLDPSLIIMRTAPFFMEITPRRISKGQGIREMCRIMGIGTEQVIAFGDSENDLTMLQTAGMGVAMGNSAPHIKAAADMVTLSNNEDGIAYALDKLIFSA